MKKLEIRTPLIIIRQFLINKFKCKNDDLLFVRNEFGKPYLINYIKFNISHSKDWVVVAIGNQEIGIDIEKEGDIQYWIMERCFCENEVEYIKKRKIDSRFYQIWSLKESYIKAVGKGLYIPMKSFEIFPTSQKEGWRAKDEKDINFKDLEQNIFKFVCQQACEMLV